MSRSGTESSSGLNVRPISALMRSKGKEALSRVLRDLPPDLPAQVLVAQHLGGVVWPWSGFGEIVARHRVL